MARRARGVGEAFQFLSYLQLVPKPLGRVFVDNFVPHFVELNFTNAGLFDKVGDKDSGQSGLNGGVGTDSIFSRACPSTTFLRTLTRPLCRALVETARMSIKCETKVAKFGSLGQALFTRRLPEIHSISFQVYLDVHPPFQAHVAYPLFVSVAAKR